MKLKKAALKAVGKIVNKVTSSTVQGTSAGVKSGYTADSELIALCRRIGAESVVMLKNNGNVLPLDRSRKVSVFGRVQNDYFYVGYGSGGDVNAPYKISLMQALRNDPDITVNTELADEYECRCAAEPVDNGFWGHWPMCYDELSIDAATAKKAAANSDTAIVVIGRAAGEDRENKLEKGSYYLTDDETALLDSVTAEFDKVIVLLNCGSIMDMAALDAYGDKISALLYVWQSGMESGNALADVLSGRVSPSGKLTDTIARDYYDYPSAKDFGGKDYNFYTEDIYVGYRWFETFAKNRVLYPFGFGLSYTDFTIDNVEFFCGGEAVNVTAKVTNTGSHSGREVLQLYCEAPCGRLGKPARVLVGFKKTCDLAPGEAQEVKISAPLASFASYDDENEFAYLLEKGEYIFCLGTDVRSAERCGEYTLDKDIIIEQLARRSPAREPFKRIKATPNGFEYADAPISRESIKQTILDNLPAAVPQTGDRGIKLADVKGGKASMSDFVAQLSLDELEAISRGDYIMNSPLGAQGNAGAFGGVLASLRDKGVPAAITTDGPSGIRLTACSSLLPIGTGLASSWDTELVERLYVRVGEEMKRLGSDVLLAPGMNIHRNPLCGRNFEYYSEDPLLTGFMASAAVRGIQSVGVSACPKHFACNNQETNRIYNDSRLSERALREIYLKGFEICVKNAHPQNIMTSYNKINGVWGHYNYELCEMILRREWGYEGNIMTDWWMRSSKSPEFPKMRDQAYRVRAGVNVLMPGGARVGKRKPDGTLLKNYNKPEGITLGELQRNAEWVLRFIVNSQAMNRL